MDALISITCGLPLVLGDALASLSPMAAIPAVPGEPSGFAGEPLPRPGLVLALVLILGVLAQWVAWRLKVPSILALLLFGFVAGPVAYWVTGDLLGWSSPVYLNIEAVLPQEVLLALVSLAVGLILFEGGLSLTFSEIRGVRNAVLSLVTIGAVVTWVVATLAAGLILGLPWSVATLLGAILVVTGPTVIGPLLRFVRPTGSVGKILKWEGIVIDPIGALLAVLVFEAVVSEHGLREVGTIRSFVEGAVLASVIGTALGLAAAGGFVLMMRRFLLPDHLQVPVALAFASGAFVASNAVVHEAGLFATTIMGIALANQKRVKVGHILEFKETLVVLMIALLFIALSARLKLSDLGEIDPLRAAGFLLVLVVVGRPLAIFASTLGPLGRKVEFRDKLFLSWMAPRGIVAAAIASVFGLSLQQRGVEGAELLAPYVFLTIVATVALYGLTSVWVARRLNLANPDNAGFLIAGAGPLGRQIAKALQNEKVEVLLVDLNYANVQRARGSGLSAKVANILGSQVREEVELTGIGRLLAITPNNEVNSLAAVQYARHFGRSNTFQLSPDTARSNPKANPGAEKTKPKGEVSQELTGRVLFANGPAHARLEELFSAGATVRKTRLTKEFGFDRWKQIHNADAGDAIILFVVDENGVVRVATADSPLQPKAGQSVIALTREGAASPVPATKPPRAAEAEPQPAFA